MTSIAGSAHSEQLREVTARLGPEGDILVWLVAGPLPNPGRPHEACEGFDRDWLGPEATADPVEAGSFEADGRTYRWNLTLADPKKGLDFARLFRGDRPAVAYACARIHSPVDTKAAVLLGSDDGVKLWVNGELVHTRHLARGVKRDEDRADIGLKRGANTFVFKVDQGEGGWGLVARIVRPDGTPASVVTQKVTVLPPRDMGGDDPLRFVIDAAGRKGSLDVGAAIQYGEWLPKAARWLERFRSDARDPEKLTSALASGTKNVDAALAPGKDADALSSALKRAVEDVRSRYDHSREPLLRQMQSPPPLVDADPKSEDFLGQAPGGRYFVHADGSPFLPIGYNHNPDWPELIQSYPLFDRYDPAVTDKWFARLKELGINLVRLMIETPTSGAMEDPIGTFVPEHTRWVDNVFLAARKHGIKLMVIPWDTFWMNMRWDICLYNHELGGPVVERIDWLTKPAVKEAQKKRLKWMIDRWGNMGDVFCWELMNEIDIWWGASPEQVEAWSREMADYVRAYQKQKWGRNHMIAVSTAAPMPRGVLGDFEFRSSYLDMATTHLYIGASKAPSEPVEPARNIAEGVRYALSQIRDNRPYFDSENGPIDRWISDDALDTAVLHNMSWAHLASGGCGSSLRWPYRHPHHLSDGQLQVLSRMAVFVREVPWKKITGPYSAGPTVKAPEGCLAYSSGSREAGIAWVLRKDGKPGDVTLALEWPGGPGALSWRAFDTQQGEWVASGDAPSGTQVTVRDAPPSVAVILEGKTQ